VWGEGRTDASGRFEIPYTPEAEWAHLVVRAVDEKGKELVTSPVLFNAKEKETVQLTRGGVFRGLPEFESMKEKILPFLKGPEGRALPVHELKPEDLDFLSGGAGVDSERLSRWVEAEKLAKEAAGLVNVDGAALPPGVFYAWLHGLPSDLSSLLKQDNETLQGAIEGAARDHLIDATPEQMKGWMDTVVALKSGAMLKPAGKDEPASMGDLLKVALGDSKKIQPVLEALAKTPARDAAALQNLGKETGLKAEEQGRIARVLEFGALSGNHSWCANSEKGGGRPDAQKLGAC
jgi:hypothetical protein